MNRIGFLSLVVAVLAFGGSFIVPEVRKFFHLDFTNGSADPSPLGFRVIVREELEKVGPNGSTISVTNQAPKTYHAAFSDQLRVESSYTHRVSALVGVSGRGRTSIDILDNGKAVGHAQDDFFAGYCSLKYRFTTEFGNKVTMEILSAFEKPYP